MIGKGKVERKKKNGKSHKSQRVGGLLWLRNKPYGVWVQKKFVSEANTDDNDDDDDDVDDDVDDDDVDDDDVDDDVVIQEK